jgi:hypothetical protein
MPDQAELDRAVDELAARRVVTQADVDRQVERLRDAGHRVVLGEFTDTAGCAFMGGVGKRTIERWRDEGRGPPIWDGQDADPVYAIAECIGYFRPRRRDVTTADIRRHSPVDSRHQARKTGTRKR